MIIVGLDTETTGVAFEKGDRIVEICLGIYHFDPATNALSLLKTITQRVNPMRSIPIEAQRVHGISLEDLRDMPTWPDIADKIEKVLAKADLLVIHNAAFDESFIYGEMQACGKPVRRVPSFCTMENGRWATFDGKKPSLAELAWSLDIPYDGTAAHAADYDVGVLMHCYAKAVTLGLFQPSKGNLK